MVMQVQDVIDQQLEEELNQIDSGATIQEAQDAERPEEAAEAVDGQDASSQEAFVKAAEAIKANEPAPEPQTVDKSYVDAQFANIPNIIRREMENALQVVAPPSQPVAPVAASSPDPDVAALENMLRSGRPDITDDQLAHYRQQYLQQKAAIEEQQKKAQEPDRIAAIEEEIRKIGQTLTNPPRPPSLWTDEQVQQINQAIDTLALANGMEINRQDPTQMNGVTAGVQAGEDVQSVIQKIGANIGQIKSNYVQATPVNQALQTTVAGLPQVAGTASSNDALTFQTEDDIRDAIALNKINYWDYERYRAQLPGR